MKRWFKKCIGICECTKTGICQPCLDRAYDKFIVNLGKLLKDK